MANALHEAGRNGFLKSGAANVNWVTGLGGSGIVNAVLMQTTTFTTGIKQISGATTGATAAAVACTAHGFTNGDIVLISGVGGTTTANGIWVIGGQTTNAFNLFDPTNPTLQGTLVGTYTSGGYAVNLGPSLGTWASYSANILGGSVTTANCQAIATPTEADGVASAAGVTFPSVPVGNPITGIMLLASSSSVAQTLTSTDVPIAWIDGQMIVTCGGAIAAATTLPVERIPAPIASGIVLAFSDGNTATLSGAASAFARTLTVSSATVTVGARATAPATGSGLPVTPNGGNISITWDTVSSPPTTGQHVGIFKL
jgi:hypothetical protein